MQALCDIFVFFSVEMPGSLLSVLLCVSYESFMPAFNLFPPPTLPPSSTPQKRPAPASSPSSPPGALQIPPSDSTNNPPSNKRRVTPPLEGGPHLPSPAHETEHKAAMQFPPLENFDTIDSKREQVRGGGEGGGSYVVVGSRGSSSQSHPSSFSPHPSVCGPNHRIQLGHVRQAPRGGLPRSSRR